MIGTSTKALFLEFFRTQELLRYIQNHLFVRLHPDYRRFARGAEADTLVESVRNQAKVLAFNQKTFEKFLRITVDGLVAGGSPKAASNFVRSHAKRVQQKIQALPNTLDKAYDALRALIEVDAFKSDQVYDAIVLLSDEISREIISQEVLKWKEEEKRHKEEQKYLLPSSIFWISLDLMADIDGMSRYRFREHFDIGEFESAFAEVESMFESGIATAAGMGEIKPLIYGSHDLTLIAYELWLASRSYTLANRIRDSINVALQNIALLQSPEGWWTDCSVLEQHRQDSKSVAQAARYLPSTYSTALCCLDLLKLSSKESQRQKAVQGAYWLLERQNPDGSWSREEITKEGVTYEPGIFLSLLCLEVLIRSGIKNIDHSIESGVDWIIRKQDDFGTWDDEGFPFPFMTVLVLELIKLKDTFAAALGPYETMSKGFLQRGLQLSLEDNPNSRRLAIVTAYHGIEAFLYSVLSQPNMNIPIFDKRGNTIGMRKALDSFQAYLEKTGYIKADEAVSYRNSLDRLAYLRD